MKKNNTQDYGKELGYGIKEGLKGLNTVASPKSKKKCERLITIPLLLLFISMIILGTNAENIDSKNTLLISFCFLGVMGMGLYQFYLGKIKKGIIYTFTFGFFIIGALIDLFKLKVTHTLKDSNGFPLIY